MAMSQPFTTVSQALVNLDWADQVSGIGHIIFYPTISTTNYLSRRLSDSSSVYLSATNGTSQYDLDYEFKTSMFMEGNAVFNFTQRNLASSAGNVRVTVYHVAPDTTETSLGTAITATRSGTTTWRENITISLTSINFSVGDKLRITVAVYSDGGNTQSCYADPNSGLTLTDNYGRTVGTDFICDMPFRVEQT